MSTSPPPEATAPADAIEPAVAAAARCDATAFTPDINNMTLSARGSFRCTTRHRRAHVKVVLQAEVNGVWQNLAEVDKTVDMRPGRTYRFRTTPIACVANPKHTPVRTHVALRPGDGAPPVIGTSPSWTVFCVD